jgi:hypothetical protein
MDRNDYEIIDKTTQNAYDLPTIKRVIIDKIDNTYNMETLKRIVAHVFGWEGQIVRWWDDDGFGLAFPKGKDCVQEHLAKMAIRELVN